MYTISILCSVDGGLYVANLGALSSCAYSVSSRIAVMRSSEDGGFRRRQSWCTVLLCLQCISMTCNAVIEKCDFISFCRV